MNSLSNAENAKGLNEIAALRLLIERCSLPIDPSSIEKRAPREPDLLCKAFSGEIIAFEVASLCDSEIAKSIAAGNKARTDAYWTSDPSENIVRNKLKNTYQTNYPIELLLYWDGRIVTPDDIIIPKIRPIIYSLTGPYRRAWFLGETTACLIWEVS